ncbi:endo-1,4-beta-xylanase [Allomuricauda sp. CP2A]|jgi:endo-1,4-beta-xylanase|uniref:endo-1,4-beta-xylanase n=1 Tax=Allomuricauda sp. CP2A TaxID=1848189 RepID=UPI0020FFF8DD|nr:endo-1,4-beta-xylanase [Muricauda sp. CP2A]
MNTNRKKGMFLCFMGILIMLHACGEKNTSKDTQEVLTLQKAFSNDFLIGVAINRQLIEERDSLGVQLLIKEFNAISPENEMKWMNIHPQPDSFYFDISDKYVALGENNDMFTLGHTLVWHSQLADYMAQTTDSTLMADYLKDHINTIVNRYKGKIDAWDVVNEALNEDGTLRESVFLKVLGEDYIETAFQLAASADPDVKLLYNDYNLCNPEKREGVVRLVKRLQEKGIKIDGVGMQGHWGLTQPSLAEIEKSIKAYSDLGVKVSITELDITVLPNPWDLEGAEVSQNFENSEKMNPYPDELPDSVKIQLAQRYKDIFKIFLKHKDNMDRVTFWGINDGNTWLNNWPIRGRSNYPLLFDREYLPKKAYDSVLALKAN